MQDHIIVGLSTAAKPLVDSDAALAVPGRAGRMHLAADTGADAIGDAAAAETGNTMPHPRAQASSSLAFDPDGDIIQADRRGD